MDDAYVSIFGTTNDYNFTSQTAHSLFPEGIFSGNGRGLSLTNNTSATVSGAFVRSTFDPPDPCNVFPNLATQPFVGQGSLISIWAFTIPKKGSKTLVTTYKPI